MKLILIFLYLLLGPLKASEVRINFFHTNDLHSHFEGVKHPIVSDESKGHYFRGGFGRIATTVENLKKEKAERGEILIGIDAGDFFAGTIFSAIAPNADDADFPEYEFLHNLGMSALILGNHEFDAGNIGFETMLRKISSTANYIPLIASNLYLKENSTLGQYVGPDRVIRKYVIKEYHSKNQKIKIGYIGILGPDGCLVSRSTRGDVKFIGFDDSKSKANWSELIDHLQKIIDELKNDHNADLVVLSMHGGGEESDKLAKSLKNLNLIIAGHTHKKEFRIVNDVIITQTGSYGESLGFLELRFDSVSKKLSLKNSEKEQFIPITEEIVENNKWKLKIKKWKGRAYQLMGHKNEDADKLVFIPNQDYIRARELFNPMGELVTKAMREELNRKYNLNLDIYFTSMGLVRSSFFKGVAYNESDVFEAVSIGFDSSLRPGTEIVSFYLTAKELVTLINFLEIYSHFSNSFSPALSPNLTFKVRTWGIPFFNRIYDILLDGKSVPEDRLLHVATNSFVFSNIETIKKISYGFVDITPKDSTGKDLNVYSFHSKEYIHLIDYLRRQSGKL